MEQEPASGKRVFNLAPWVNKLAYAVALFVGWSGAQIAIWAAGMAATVAAVAGLFLLIFHGVLPKYVSSLVAVPSIQGITIVTVFAAAFIAGLVTLTGFYSSLLLHGTLSLFLALLLGAALSAAITWVIIQVESRALHLRGYRQLTTREQLRLEPLLDRVLTEFAMTKAPWCSGPPSLYMAHIETPNAWAHTHSIVLTEGLLLLDDDAVLGVLAHEVAHISSGHALGLRMYWSAAWPVLVFFDLLRPVDPQGKVIKRPHGFLSSVIWFFFWSSYVLVKWVFVPTLAASQRSNEYEADKEAARVGHAHGLYDALGTMELFESGRTGFEWALSQTHPPTPLRRDRLEQYEGHPLGD